MSKTFSKARVSLTAKEMRDRKVRREFKTRNISTHADVEILDRRFDYERFDVLSQINMRQDHNYYE